ncbi:MAG: tyrosine--tRNA ligase [Thermoplasmata archaeon]|nr:tyrosine--tRNA ligase [Thermoplasmata archaeon]
MDLEEKIERLEKGTEEIVTHEELRNLLETNDSPRAYIGLEPSGLMHIGQGIPISEKLKDFTDVGFNVRVLLADWHAFINDKLEGNLENIYICGKYVRDALIALGVDDSKVEFLFASDLVNDKSYWEKVLKVSKASTVARIRRAMSIMGRTEEEADLDASKMIYPAMQVTDIAHMDLDVAYGGMDQRHAHMLYRDISPKLGWKKIVAIHTPLLPSLQGGGRMDAAEMKMSKSMPETCVFLHDSPDQISKKINKAFCPQDEVIDNPVLETVRMIVFRKKDELKVERPEKFGGDVVYASFDELASSYSKGELHPADLKSATAKELTEILEPARKYFEAHPENIRKIAKIIGVE